MRAMTMPMTIKTWAASRPVVINGILRKPPRRTRPMPMRRKPLVISGR